MEVIIRAAQLEDAERVVRAHEEASRVMFLELVGKPLGEVLPFEARLAEYRRSMEQVSADAQILVAESAGEIVGMAVWRREESGEGELSDLHVVPGWWGTGVAVSLMRAVVDGLQGAGVEHAFLWVGEENARARRFYEREGWRPDGAARASPLGPTEVRYRLRLGGDPPSI